MSSAKPEVGDEVSKMAAARGEGLVQLYSRVDDISVQLLKV